MYVINVLFSFYLNLKTFRISRIKVVFLFITFLEKTVVVPYVNFTISAEVLKMFPGCCYVVTKVAFSKVLQYVAVRWLLLIIICIALQIPSQH